MERPYLGVVRFAVFGDVHADLAALRALLADIEAAGVRRIWCLGDFALSRRPGQGAPAQCFDLIMERAEVVLAGNWESGPNRLWVEGHRRGLDPFRSEIEQLGPVRLRQILGLQPHRVLPELGIELAHASLACPLYEHVRDVASAERCLAKATQPIVIVGHTHTAAFFRQLPDGTVERVSTRVGTPYLLAGRCVLNPGGGAEGIRPRRGATNGRWLEITLDAVEPTATWHRVRVP